MDVVAAQLGDDSVLWGGLALAETDFLIRLFLEQAVEGGAGVVGVARARCWRRGCVDAGGGAAESRATVTRGLNSVQSLA